MRVVVKGGGPSVELLSRNLPVRELRGTFELIEAALTSTIETQFRETGRKRLRLRPIAVSSANLFEEMYLEDARGIALGRAWSGYPGTDQPDRIAVEFSLQILEHSVPQRFVVRPATSEDRELLAHAWNAGEIPWFAEAPMLILARSLGSPELLDKIVARLDSKDAEVQSLALEALAAITGWDARKASDGGVRPLDDVVADYKRECVRSEGSRAIPDAGRRD